GQKVVLNEFLAYLDLARIGADGLSPRSRLILTYALCGFANLGSLGIMVGGLTAMAPGRRTEIIALAPRAVLVGVMATLLTGAVAGGVIAGPMLYARYALALALGALGALVFVYARLPLPWFLGSLTACLIASVLDLPIARPKPLSTPMRAVLGVAVGSAFTPL